VNPFILSSASCTDALYPRHRLATDPPAPARPPTGPQRGRRRSTDAGQSVRVPYSLSILQLPILYVLYMYTV
jgi:hypothetical protein